MKTNRYLAIFLILLLALSLAACGEDEPTATPEPVVIAATDTPVPPTNTPVPPTNTPAPAAVPPTNTPAAAAASVAGNFMAPSAVLDAFRTRGEFLITSTFPDATTSVQNMTMEGAFVKADNAYGSDEFFLMTINEADSVETTAIYKIGDWVSANAQGEWISVGRDNAGLFTVMSDLFTSFVDEFLLEGEGATNLGDETVDNVVATHYQMNDVSIFTRMAEMAPDSDEVIEKAQMDIWVAKEAGYVLKYSIEAQVSNVKETDASGAEVSTTQSVQWSYEVYDVNGNITVALPADAPKPGDISIPGFAEGEFPVPAGGKMAANMTGMPEVTGDLSQEELVAFYTDAFAALDWSFSGDFGFYEVKKGDVSFAMFIDTDDSGKGRAQVFTEQ